MLRKLPKENSANSKFYIKSGMMKCIGTAKDCTTISTKTNQMAEIFCVDYINNEFNDHIFNELVKQSLSTCKELDVYALVFFVEGLEHDSATKLGFTSLGKYLHFIKIL